MKRFLYLIILFVFLLVGLLIIGLEISSEIVKNRQFKNYNTESNLLFMNVNKKYDILIMGISHARNFSRYNNQLRVENILNKKIINIGQGGGQSGVNEQLFYLDYFYSNGNSTSTIFYFISPPLFYSNDLPIASNTFLEETFELKFFMKYLFFKTENKQERLTSYLQSKFDDKWFSLYPDIKTIENGKLDSINYKEVVIGQKLAYKDTLDYQRFKTSSFQIEKTIQLAKKNNSTIVLIIPPALFGKWPGHYKIDEFGKQMQKKYNIEYYDLSKSVLTPKYYYDHHHLNTEGVLFFTKNFLKPIATSKKSI